MSFLQECIDNVDPELFDELIEIKNEVKTRPRSRSVDYAMWYLVADAEDMNAAINDRFKMRYAQNAESRHRRQKTGGSNIAELIANTSLVQLQNTSMAQLQNIMAGDFNEASNVNTSVMQLQNTSLAQLAGNMGAELNATDILANQSLIHAQNTSIAQLQNYSGAGDFNLFNNSNVEESKLELSSKIRDE